MGGRTQGEHVPGPISDQVSNFTIAANHKIVYDMGCHRRNGVVVRAGVGKLRPAGRMRPSRAICAAREDFLKLCHL